MTQPVDYAFLHGGGQGSWVWDETIAALGLQTAGRFGRALALDVPGCGTKRGRQGEALGPREVADELVADLERAGLRDVVLVGHSQAGNLLPFMLQARPRLFRRLVYISCSAPMPGQTVLQMMGSGLHGEREDEIGWPCHLTGDDFSERYPVMFCNDMAPGEAEAFLAKLGPDQWPAPFYGFTDWRFEALEAAPASYVVCLRDQILPVSWQERFAERYRARHIVRIDAGHQAMNTRPHGLAEILRHAAGLG